jgi:hypothetical protein
MNRAAKQDRSDEYDVSWTAHRKTAVLVGILLLLHGGLALDVARQFTVTHDEYWHIPVGLLNLKTFRFDYDNLNPPLIRMVAAFPLWVTMTESGDVPVGADPRMVGDAFLDAYAANNSAVYADKVLLARIPMVLLSILTGWMLATWSLQEFGPVSAVFVTIFWAASPMVLGCASLVTTDLGSGALFVAAIWRAWRYASDPSWANAMWMAVALGLGPLAKYTCILAIPFAIATWWIRRAFDCDRIEQPWRTTIGQWLVATAVSLTIINAGFLFTGSGQKMADYKFRSRLFSTTQQWLVQFANLPLLLPSDLVLGMDHQRMMLEGNHPVYLDRAWSEHGSPDYFVRAIAYKVPHGYQLAFVLAVLFAVSAGGRKFLRLNVVLLLPAAILLALASASGMQLGLRYIFPVFPLAFVFMSQLGQIRWQWSGPAILTTLAVVGCLVSVRHHPNHLACFNELSGGIDAGRERLLDSNIDWGQDLFRLPGYMQQHNIDKIGLAYFGMIPPDRLGLNFTIPVMDDLQPGWYAISVNFVCGRPHTIRDPTGAVLHTNIGAFSMFRLFDPVDHLGQSIDVYHISEIDIVNARALIRQSR